MQCPEPRKLQQVLDETLAADEQQAIQAHLETCAPCQRKIEQLAAGGVTWDKTAQSLGAEPQSDETALADALVKLQNDSTDPDQTRAEAVAASVDEDLSFLQPSTKPGSIGRLDDYEILSIVGKGGFGIVLKAFDENLHRIVAIKVMLPHLAANGAARERFTREAKAAAAVTHENIVTIHAVARKAKIPYLVMQFVSGVTLNEKIDKAGPLPVKEILRIGMQIAEGLTAAHKQGLIHRDIKPGNILLENGIERVKITDFGLARAADDASVTQSGTVAGTPMYMSPEQANGEAIDPRSDLFSLGSVLYVMCTGRPPFRATSTMAVMKRVCEDTPTPVQQVNTDIPDWLAGIIEKLHAKKPADRYQTAKEVAEFLGQRLADLQTGRAEGRKAPGEAPTTQTLTRPLTGLGSPRPRRTWLRAGAALLVLALLAGLGYVFNPFRERLGTVILRAEDVLPRLVGTWSIDVETTLPKPDTAKGVVRFDWVASGKFLRSYTTYDQGSETLTVHRYAGDDKNFKRWFLSSQSAIQAIQSGTDGEWDMKTQTMTYRGTLPLFHKITHVERWVDVNHVEINTEIKDHLGSVILHQTKKMKRTADAAVGPKAPVDPKRPAEFALLDGQVGSWNTTVDVTLAEWGGKKVQSRTTNETVPILAHRFVESKETQEHGRQEYWLFGYDEFRRIYRVWHFGADGEAMESDGSYDPKERTLTWKSLDGRYNGTWTFTNDDERHATMSAKDAQGRRLFDVTGISRRDAAVAANDGWVQLFNRKDLTGWKSHNDDPGGWHVVGDVLVGTGDERYLFSERSDYRDFHLRVEAKIIAKGNSGVHFRSALAPKLPAGYEAQINIGSDPYETGSLMVFPWNEKTSILHHVKDKHIAPDTWFILEVIAQGSRIVIKVNDKTVTDMVNDQYRSGHFALQAGRLKTEIVQFKRIEVKELSPEEPGWVKLFNGKDLQGWVANYEPNDKEQWKVADGELSGRLKTLSYLRTDKKYRSFVMRLDYKIEKPTSPGTTHGIVRWQLLDDPTSRTSLQDLPYLGLLPDAKVNYGFRGRDAIMTGQAEVGAEPEGGWNKLELTCTDDKQELRVNGKVGVSQSNHYLKAGYLALTSASSGIKFRNIEIKEDTTR